MTRPRHSFALCRAAGALVVLALLAACSGSGPAGHGPGHTATHTRGNYAPPGPPSDPWGPYIHEAAERFDMPEQWIRGLMRQESGGREYAANGQLITSSAGAMGLMQVMPGTFDELRARHNLGDDPYDPHDNILAGVAYMREMYDIYGAPGFLAAYNAGPARLDDYLANNRPLPDETRRYVAIIGPRLAGVTPRRISPAAQYAMNDLPLNIPRGTRYGRPGPIAYNDGNGRIPVNAPVVTAQLPLETPLAPPPPPVAEPTPVRTPEPRFAANVPQPPPASPAPQRRTSFVLIPSAQAAEPVPYRRPAGEYGQWAIQVGAYANQNDAHAALNAAKGRARAELAVAHPYVGMVHQARGNLWRARLTGLSHETATQACQKLLRSHATCVVLSPDAQS